MIAFGAGEGIRARRHPTPMENASRNPKISFIAIPQFTGGYFIANFRVRGSAALEKTDKADSSIARFAKTTSRDICALEYCIVVMANCFGSRMLDLRQFVDVPVPTQSLDQQNTRIELAPSDIDVILFVAESSRL
jgi:hypothetical protein